MAEVGSRLTLSENNSCQNAHPGLTEGSPGAHGTPLVTAHLRPVLKQSLGADGPLNCPKAHILAAIGLGGRKVETCLVQLDNMSQILLVHKQCYRFWICPLH